VTNGVHRRVTKGDVIQVRQLLPEASEVSHLLTGRDILDILQY
jgi:hypothetical protein